MNLQPRYVNNLETTRREKTVKRGEGVITQMLMINSVKLNLIKHVFDIRSLDDCDAVRLKDCRDSCDEARKLGNVGQHVVGVKYVGRDARGAQSHGCLDAEKIAFGPDAIRIGNRRDIASRLNPQDSHAPRDVMLEQVSVIAGGFDDQAVRA